jgi:transcriptional regulator with XRE-family HTH domain
MARSTHHPNYQALLTLLRDFRERAGLTQLALAECLGNTQTFISKVERGERRIDVVEFVEICDALGVDPVAAFSEYLTRCSLLGRKGNKLTR